MSFFSPDQLINKQKNNIGEVPLQGDPINDYDPTTSEQEVPDNQQENIPPSPDTTTVPVKPETTSEENKPGEFPEKPERQDELDDIQLEVPKDQDTNSVESTYTSWQQDQSMENLNKVVAALRPTINYALAQYQAVGDPYIETQAKILTAQAIKNYDPSYNVTLPTYVTSQLRKLSRIVREARNPIQIPERMSYEIAELNEAEAKLTEEMGGKEPDVQQLADYMGVSVKKIEQIRKARLKQVSEGQYYGSENADTESEDAASLEGEAQSKPDYAHEAIAYVHSVSDYRERKVLEWSTGYGGAPILSQQEIAQKLQISQSQVSRIMAKLAAEIEENINALEEAYG